MGDEKLISAIKHLEALIESEPGKVQFGFLRSWAIVVAISLFEIAFQLQKLNTDINDFGQKLEVELRRNSDDQ